jgi:hypothetical protein
MQIAVSSVCFGELNTERAEAGGLRSAVRIVSVSLADLLYLNPTPHQSKKYLTVHRQTFTRPGSCQASRVGHGETYHSAPVHSASVTETPIHF